MSNKFFEIEGLNEASVEPYLFNVAKIFVSTQTSHCY